MPNWCNNFVELTHEDPAMLIRAKDALDRGEFLQEFIPVPKDLTDTMSGSHGDPVQQALLEAKTKANLDKYGYGNWYDYCVGEWGTKWDVGQDGCTDIHPEGTILTTSFDSAWAPPCTAYEKLMEQGFAVRAMYYEPGMNFCGIWDNGDDEYYEIPATADEVEAELPSELDEMFDIAQSIRDYQDEEEEELTTWIKEGAEARKDA